MNTNRRAKYIIEEQSTLLIEHEAKRHMSSANANLNGSRGASAEYHALRTR